MHRQPFVEAGPFSYPTSGHCLPEEAVKALLAFCIVHCTLNCCAYRLNVDACLQGTFFQELFDIFLSTSLHLLSTASLTDPPLPRSHRFRHGYGLLAHTLPSPRGTDACTALNCTTCSEWGCSDSWFGWEPNSEEADTVCQQGSFYEAAYPFCSLYTCCNYNPQCEDWDCGEGFTNLVGACYEGERRRLATSSSSTLGYCSDSTCCQGESRRRFLGPPAKKITGALLALSVLFPISNWFNYITSTASVCENGTVELIGCRFSVAAASKERCFVTVFFW